MYQITITDPNENQDGTYLCTQDMQYAIDTFMDCIVSPLLNGYIIRLIFYPVYDSV